MKIWAYLCFIDMGVAMTNVMMPLYFLLTFVFLRTWSFFHETKF